MGAQLSKGAGESEVIKAGGKGEMSLTCCQRRKAYYICVLHLHEGLVELLPVMSVCANPQWPQECSCGVCVAGVEGNPIARRACPLPSQLAKRDHNECLRARIPNHGTGTGQETLETVSDSASPAAEWTLAQGNPQGPLALPLNQNGKVWHIPGPEVVTLPHITAASMRHLALTCDAAQPRGLGAAPHTFLPSNSRKEFPFSFSRVCWICPTAAHWKISLEDRRANC